MDSGAGQFDRLRQSAVLREDLRTMRLLTQWTKTNMSKHDHMTQSERILAYLRKHKKATNMELSTKCGEWIGCPWKRVDDLEVKYYEKSTGAIYGFGRISSTERITRHTIKTKGGALVTQYRLERI